MDKIILTNNPLVKEQLAERIEVELLECSYREILLIIRDRVHQGVKLLTHPLSGSIKPNETPFKSVMLTKKTGKTIDHESLSIIEDSIVTFDKFAEKHIHITEKVRNDFSVVDATLIRSAVDSAIQ